MLGDQFRDTYSLDGPRGGARYYSATDAGELRNSTRPLNRNYQGSLFNPHEATETDLDPSVDKEGRRELIRNTFRMEDDTNGYDLAESIAQTGLPNHAIRGWENPPTVSAEKPPHYTFLGAYYPKNHHIEVDPDLNRTDQKRTAIHELGHAAHLQGAASENETMMAGAGGDELQEGTADGFADRYATYATRFPEALDTSQSRRRAELTRGRSGLAGSGTGYGASHPAFRGGNIGAAVYVAQRQKTAMTGEMPRPAEKTDTYAANNRYLSPMPTNDNETLDAMRLTLGSMYKSDPSVRDTLRDVPGLQPWNDNLQRTAYDAKTHLEARQKIVSSAQKRSR